MWVVVQRHHLHNHWDITRIGQGEEFRLKEAGSGWGAQNVTIQCYDLEHLMQSGGDHIVDTAVPTSVSISKVGAN